MGYKTDGTKARKKYFQNKKAIAKRRAQAIKNARKKNRGNK
jgi:hypothetical protein